jgi:hypothetical protein
MIKTVIDKLEDVVEVLRPEYKQGADGRYYAELDKLPDSHPVLTGLLTAKQHEVDAHAATTAKLNAAKADLEKTRAELQAHLKGKGTRSEIEALEASWQQKLSEEQVKHTEALALRDASLRGVLVDSESKRIAAKIALNVPSAELLAESIQRRLTVEIGTDGKAVTRVLDLAGKPSAATLDDLEKEIVATPKYAALLSGNRATGGSAPGSSGAGSALPGKIDWLRGNPAEIAAAAAKVNPLLGG